jgi:glyoxylase-like metal-dependent hydrolase (beta-lactamase superfamily II)
MGRWLARIALLLVVAVAITAIYAYQTVSRIEAEQITEDVHVLFGLGSNVGVLRTTRGAAIVDTMTFRMQGEEIRKRVEALTGREVEVILNTHYHLDHTHGNPAFPGGSRFVATKRTRELLDAFDAASWQGEAAKTLPNETFEGSYEIALGDKTIRAIHPGRGHTSGDMVVLFVEDRVIHLGDLFFNGRYPNIDLEGGGSVKEWIATLDRVLAIDGYDQVIPGHGPVSDRDGIRAFQAFLRELWEQASAAAAAGKSLEETLASVRLTTDAGFEPIRVPLVLNLDQPFVIRRAWEEATGTVRPQGPAAQDAGATP